LAKLPLRARKDRVLAAINTLGPDLSNETPLPGDAKFGAEVEAWQKRTGACLEDAVLFSTLAGLKNPGSDIKALLEAVQSGKLSLTADARSQWLGQLATRLFGPQGPAIEGLR
jgi:hypothetical protein